MVGVFPCFAKNNIISGYQAYFSNTYLSSPFDKLALEKQPLRKKKRTRFDNSRTIAPHTK